LLKLYRKPAQPAGVPSLSWAISWTMSVEECERACVESGACFAIYWEFDDQKGVLRPMSHFNPSERLQEVKVRTGKSKHYLFTTQSYTYSVKPGVGFVGKTYQSKQAMFFPDVTKLSKTDFPRKDLAATFFIVSMAIVPFAKGVLEIGSSKKREDWAWVWNHQTFVDVCEMACKETGAAFAVYWGLDEAQGVLRPVCHWNPPERVGQVKEKTGREDLYTTESYKNGFKMKVGVGVVGKTYKSKEAMFFENVSKLSKTEFLRKDLAARFGIVSMALKPFGKGVLEVGSPTEWDSCAWVQDHKLFQEACQMACKKTGAPLAIYWGLDDAKGVLRPMCHWNPPEIATQMKAMTGKDDLYTTESYKVQMKPGTGCVGKTYESKEAMFFPDVSKLSWDDFLRKDLAARFGIVSVALKPFANGVLEIASPTKWDSCAWVQDHKLFQEACDTSEKEVNCLSKAQNVCWFRLC